MRDHGLPAGVDFFIGQSELCPTTGRRHQQCYIELSAPRSISWVKRNLNDDTLHLERRQGTQEQAIQYCNKEDSFDPTGAGRFRSGRPHGGGQRVDRDNQAADRVRRVFDCLASGGSTLDAFDIDPITWCRYYRQYQQLQLQLGISRPFIRRLQVHVYLGPPGSGKTCEAFVLSPTLYRLSPPATVSSPVWWDGYIGQEAVLIDDFEGWIPYRTLLQILDVYPLILPVKGGFVMANYSTVYITSNSEMNLWYGGDISALERRITEIKRFTAR